MSRKNVEMARDFITAYNRRDFDAAVQHFDPEIEWVLPDRQSSDSCRGPDEVKRFWEGIDETFDELVLRPQEFLDGGDRVATRLRHYGVGKGSGIEVDEELYHQVATFREGRIVRLEYFGTWPEALEAAGLEPQGNVDVVREQFAATNERDFPRAMSYYAEDVELVVDPEAFVEDGIFTGREAVGQWFANWFTTFEPGYHFDIEETQELGDVVLLIATHHGRGRSSGLEVRGRTGYLYTVRDAKIVRVEIHRSPAAALEAAGQ